MNNQWIDTILSRQEVITSVTLVITTLCTFLVTKLTQKTKETEAHQEAQEELARSNKRSALRNEYLQIYNSQEFTWEQKYHLTREIVTSYYLLNGNHYIHELDEKLYYKKEEETNETNEQTV